MLNQEDWLLHILGPPGLLRMLRSGDEDHIITRVVPGTDPMQDFDDDDPSQTIVIDYDTDTSSDVDDLSEVSMASAGSIGKQEFQGLLSDIVAQHQRMAASLDALASRVEDMSVEQVEEAAVRVALGDRPCTRLGGNHRSLQQG